MFYDAPWQEGKENLTEAFATSGASRGPLWRREESALGNGHIDAVTNTLVESNQVTKKTFLYDAHNNQTDVYEYDYGTGAAPANYVRRTHTDYLTTNSINGQSYNTPYPIDPANPMIHIRNVPSQTQVFDASGNKKAETIFEYDDYSATANHAALVNRTNISGFDTTFSTSYTTRGNVTKVTNWRNVGGADITSYMQYDIAGNVVKTIDANGNATTFDFNDRFGSPTGDAQQNAVNGEGTYTTAPSYWLGSLTTYAFPTKVTNALGHIAYTQFDYFLGQAVDTEDPNGIKSSLYYDDALDRPTKGIRAVGTSLANQTVITYDDTNKVITVATDKDANQDGVLQSKALYDGLGRTWRKASYEGSNNWAIVETQFDALGRAYRSSKAFRDSSPTAALPMYPEWTISTFDALGRVTQVKTPDDAHVDTAYEGNQVMVTDQAGKKRISQTDALGRLLKVWEVTPSDSWTTTVSFGGQNQTAYLTTYAYDTLDNLTTVTQGAQTRTFSYDSLKRLTSAYNPESGTTYYNYYDNGNLWKKTDARTTETTFNYDALNRVTSKTYSGTPGEGADAANATAPVYYKYDNQSLPSGAPSGFNRGYAIGRLVAVTYGSSTTSTGSYFGYDELGRGVRKTQQIGGNNYAMTASYNLASMMTSASYPSTRTTNYTYNTAGQLATFSGTIGDGTSRTYVSSATYSPAGQKEREAYGMTTPLYLKLHYNKRQQLVDLRLGSVNDEWNWNRGALIFYYGTNAVANWNPFADDTDNNGNVRRAVNYVPLDDAITNHVVPQLADYTYDALNRIGSYTEAQYSGSWSYNVAGQTFSYDRYGNRQITATLGGVNNYNPSYTASTNRIVGLTYDSAGNITNDGSKAMTYDAENHMVSATGGSYVYDGEGKRVKRTATGQEWWYVYGLSGELVAEYLSTAPTTVQKEYGYRSGQLLIVGESGNVRWLVTDHLGSTRMAAEASGSLTAMKRQDYLPFGEDLYAGIRRNGSNGQYGYEPPASMVRQKFGSKERDTETGLDFFEARYFTSVQGRFTSTDPFFFQTEMLTDPQRFNLYAYVRNNPLKFVDPDGRILRFAGDINYLRGLIEGWAGDFKDKITISDNGTVSFNVKPEDIKDNAGAQLLYDLVNDAETILFYAGNDGKAAASQFVNGNNDDNLAKQFTGEKYAQGGGSLINTRGRTGIDPSKGQTGPVPQDGVFAVIAFNTDAVVREQLGKQQDPKKDPIVPFAALYMHEGAENLEFSRMKRDGTVLDLNAYGSAHKAAIEREKKIRAQSGLQGGMAGGSLYVNAPKNKKN